MRRSANRSETGTWTVAVLVASCERIPRPGGPDVAIGSPGLQAELLTLTSKANDSQIQRFNDQIICTTWFGSALFALDSIRILLSNLNEGPSGGVPLSAGIATGECEVGSLTSRTAGKSRSLAGAASERQIVLSVSTYEVVRDEDVDPIGFKEIGTVRTEGEIRRERVFQLTHPDLTEPLPSVFLQDAIVNNSPRRFGYLVGRVEEIEEISTLLDSERAVTLVGPPGIGKSHLACRVAGETIDTWAEGVVWIDLSGATSTRQFQLALLQALNLRGIELDSAEAEAVRLLRGRDLAVVLDNADHCRALTSNLIQQLCRSSGPRFIVTSAVRLNIPIENVVRIEGLSLPPSHDILSLAELEDYESTALFLDRARLARRIQEQDVSSIVEICHRLKGNSLAIVLAAKRVKQHRPERILERLKGGPGKYASLGRAIQSSLDGLEAGPLTLLKSVSVLQGIWSRDEGSALADTMDSETAANLQPLMDAGLVIEVDGFRGSVGYRLDGPVSDHVAKLATSDEVSEFKERHALHFIGLLSQSMRHQDGAEQGRHWDLLDWYRRDLAVAIAYTIEPGRNPSTFVEAMVFSGSYWYQRNRTREAIILIELGLKAFSDRSHVDAARLLNIAGVLAMKAGDYRASSRYYGRALQIAEKAGHHRLVGSVLNNLATLQWIEARPERAVPLFERAVDQFQGLNDPSSLGRALVCSILSVIETGDLTRAENYLHESRRLLEESGDGLDRWALLISAGQVDVSKSRFEDAKRSFEESLRVAGEIGDMASLARSLLWLAQVQCDSHHFAESAEFLGAMRSVGSLTDSDFYPTNEIRVERISGTVRDAIGDEMFRKHRLLGGIGFNFK